MQHDEDGGASVRHGRGPREDRVLVEQIEARGRLIEQQHARQPRDGRLPDLRERTRAVSRTTGAADPESGVAPVAPGYAVEDLFGSYQVLANFKLFASVENVGNREYFDGALATVASPGRMVKVGFTAALGR